MASEKALSLLGGQPSVSIEGSLDRVTFHNGDNGYTVLRLKPRNGTELINAVGHMLDPKPGAGLKLTGAWSEHPRFGRQFMFQTYETMLPAGPEGIRAYLASGLIKGVRQGMAARIVEAFGEDTFRVLDEAPELLLTVKGVSQRLAENIRKGWAEHQGIRDLIVFLEPHGVSTAYAVRIFKHYGPQALEVVRDNPYRLAMDISGIGFLTADKIALKLGIDEESPLRAEAGILYMLRKVSEEGHIYYPLPELVELAFEELSVPPPLLERAVRVLADEERVVLEDLDDMAGNACQAVYLTRHHVCETGISHYLNRIQRSPKSVIFSSPAEALAIGLAKSALDLAEGQIQAVEASLRSKVLIITGGPGTGKTTIINTIIKIFQSAKARILLAAPTGRAAKRMAETSSLEAKTIHRLLEYSPGEDAFLRNEDNPLACGLIVVDEASMLDNSLMYHLLKAIPLGATVIFVGDINQLPSVGPGNVLADIINSGVLPVMELHEIFRQAASSAIITNAHAINQGDMPVLRPSRNLPEGENSDFYFIRQEDPEKCADLITELVTRRIPRRFRLNPVDDIQVLTPMHKGVVGVAALNARLQQSLNRQYKKLTRGDREFRLDDKVMQIRNNYDKDVFNGDIGRICHVDEVDKELTVRFEDKNVIYAQDELDEIITAYAISVHKSQGSEYPCVVMPVLTQHYIMLQRNLLYTGVTRGKKLVVIVGSTKALHIAINNNLTKKRYTWLRHRLSAAI